MTELKISIEGFNTGLKNAEERFNKLKDRSFEIIQLQEQEEKWMKKSEERVSFLHSYGISSLLQELWDIIKRTNKHFVKVWKKRRERGSKAYLKIMAENVPNLVRDRNIQIHGAQKSYPKHDQPKDYPKIHYNQIVKNQRQRERILKATRYKQVAIDKGTSIRLLTDFLAETLEARRVWDDTHSGCWKKKKLPIKNMILYSANLSLGNGEIATFAQTKESWGS